MKGKPGSEKGSSRSKKAKGGKRWAKGQSSSSNPTANRHRQLASKSRVFAYPCSSNNPYQGNLTESAVKAHDAALLSASAEDADRTTVVGSIRDDALSGSFHVPAFDRFLSKFNMRSGMHKQMLAILTAVRDIIKERDGSESETEYFATLMTSLIALESADELAAAITLVNTIIRRVPPGVLKSKFGELSQMFVELLTKHSESEHNVLVGQLISCLGFLLQVQDYAEWQHSSTQEIFKFILNFCTHPQPKIRKSARRTAFLVVSTDGRQSHPATKPTAAFAMQQLQAYKGAKSTSSIVQIMNLLKEVLGFFSQQQLKQTCETILQLMTLGNITIKTCSMMTFKALFSGLPISENLPPAMTSQIINALHAFFPAPNDSNLMPNWLSAMEAASTYLYNEDPKLSWQMLPHLFEKGCKGWLSDSVEIHQAVTSTFKALLYKMLEPLNESGCVPAAMLNDIRQTFAIVEECLKFQYHNVWDQVLHILAVFFETAGKFASSFMKKCLQSMASLRESHHFAHVNKLDYAVGKAVQSMGPEAVLSAIPLTVKEADRIGVGCPNNWIVPILRDSVSHAKLSFFKTYFLPLAESCESIGKKSHEAGKKEVASNYELLHKQLWSCLPGFCNSPTDLAENFKTIAKTLGQKLSDNPELRLDVLSALRSMVNCSLDNENDKAELTRFSKNYLPILMNLYTTEPATVAENHVRLAVLETVIVYLRVTPIETSTQLFDRLVTKIDASETLFMIQAAFDVARILLSYVDYDRIEKVYGLALQHMESHDQTVVKKCYRILQEICLAKSEACVEFMNKDRWTELRNCFSTLEAGSPAMKAIKLHGLASIISFIPKKNCTALIPKIVACVCEPSQKAKEAAFYLLEQMLQHFLKDAADEEASVQSFVGLLMSGLGKSPAMIRATVASVGCILKAFDEHVTDELVQNVLEKACLLLGADDRSVVKASLEFLIAFTPTITDGILIPHLRTIVENMMSVPDELRKPIRPTIRQLITKLIKRFGRGVVVKYVPEKHQRLITNLHKEIERKKRQQLSKAVLTRDFKHGKKDCAERKSLADLLEDSDSDNDEKEEKKLPTCIREKSDDLIVNFLDPLSSRNIQSLPVKRPTGSKDYFPVASDGRLIIGDDDDTDDDKAGRSDDDSDKPLAIDLPFEQTSSKRKLSEMEEDDEVLDTRTKVKEVGIHRVLGSHAPSDQPGMKYRAKKAKGDIKKAGQPDPYAYIPMDRSTLNKRQTSDKYKGILRAARIGAQKGTKQRARAARK